MTTEDNIIAAAAEIQRSRPTLNAQDWRVLGEIIEAGAEGLAFMKIREEPEFYGTGRKVYPTLERLIAEGLIEKIQHGRGQGAPVYFRRTGVPIVPAAAEPVYEHVAPTAAATTTLPALSFVL